MTPLTFSAQSHLTHPFRPKHVYKETEKSSQPYLAAQAREQVEEAGRHREQVKSQPVPCQPMARHAEESCPWVVQQVQIPACPREAYIAFLKSPNAFLCNGKCPVEFCITLLFPKSLCLEKAFGGIRVVLGLHIWTYGAGGRNHFPEERK